MNIVVGRYPPDPDGRNSEDRRKTAKVNSFYSSGSWEVRGVHKQKTALTERDFFFFSY